MAVESTNEEIRELTLLEQIESDPEAFMVIGMAHEALGEGFKPLRGR